MKHQCDEPVTQMHLKPAMTVGELVAAMGKAGAYNGGSLCHAAEIYEQMLRDADATKFFGLAGAMVPAGMGGIVSDLIKDGHIDILVSTGETSRTISSRLLAATTSTAPPSATTSNSATMRSTGSTMSTSPTKPSSTSRSSCRACLAN